MCFLPVCLFKHIRSPLSCINDIVQSRVTVIKLRRCWAKRKVLKVPSPCKKDDFITLHVYDFIYIRIINIHIYRYIYILPSLQKNYAFRGKLVLDLHISVNIESNSYNTCAGFAICRRNESYLCSVRTNEIKNQFSSFISVTKFSSLHKSCIFLYKVVIMRAL